MDQTNYAEVRKLKTPVCARAAAGESRPVKRLLVTDTKTGTRFLVDTGADISVLPQIWAKGIFWSRPTNRCLYGANGTIIPTYGEKEINLDFGL